MADFTYTRPDEFTVDVEGREYSMPRMDGLSAEQLVMLNDMQDAGDFVEQVGAARKFFGEICPALMDEPIADLGLLRLFKAWGAASGIGLGES